MPVIRKIRLNDRFFPPDSRSSDLLPIYIFLTTFLNIFLLFGCYGSWHRGFKNGGNFSIHYLLISGSSFL